MTAVLAPAMVRRRPAFSLGRWLEREGVFSWLMVALPQSKLKEEWVKRGIRNVASDLVKNRNVASDCGPLFHGMNALVIYRQRTVPDYLVPKFNSQIKLADRAMKPIPQAEAAAPPSRRHTPTAPEPDPAGKPPASAGK
jgi:hypothetical protein